MYRNMSELQTDDPQGNVIRNLIKMSHDVVNECDKTISNLKSHPISNTRLTLKSLVSYVESVSDMTSDTLPLSVHDISTTEKFLDDAKNIANTTIHNDIRSWEQQANQKQDALIAIQNFKTYWKQKNAKLIKAYLNPHTKSERLSYAGVPNYRFKIGQRVVTKVGRKSGKIVGVQKENGTGRQLYHVKLDDEDTAKSFLSSDLNKEE